MQQNAMRAAQVSVKVWGDFACFSRPEFKVERVSYPVMTPSAARGILEAIFWKPEIRYEIRRIGVLKLGTQLSLMRNELERRQAFRPIFIEGQRQQRASLVLKDVAYTISAEILLRPHATDHISKYSKQFERRVERGQYHHTPYLGTREFAASFEAPSRDDVPDPVGMDLGQLLFDIAYIEQDGRYELEFAKQGVLGRREAKGFTKAIFFTAVLTKGWLEVPVQKYLELYKLEGEHA
jgi:CRISPR-associated protein Cas5d